MALECKITTCLFWYNIPKYKKQTMYCTFSEADHTSELNDIQEFLSHFVRAWLLCFGCTLRPNYCWDAALLYYIL